jgi:anti-sigma regulatory factor (Ser/Thr protein kinase)
MTIGTDPGHVGRVTEAFAAFADRYTVPVQVRRSLSVALDELLHNTITHGFAGQDEGEVTVDVELGPDRLSVTLTDNARPFDPFAMAAPDTRLSLADRPIGGLGIHLVRQMMDEVVYERRGEHNVVVLMKRFAGG